MHYLSIYYIGQTGRHFLYVEQKQLIDWLIDWLQVSRKRTVLAG
jgi:hypothetical protein